MASESSQPTVFLSYAHDDRVKARRLAAALAGRGYTVWWDGLIEGGAQFAKSIREALEAADAVIVLWSAKSIESDWVCDEAAQGRDRRRLVPLSLDGSRPPLGFRQYQTIDLAAWRGKADAPQILAIDRAIAAAIGRPAGERSAPPHIASGVNRRRVIGIAAGAGAAAIVGGGLFAWGAGWLGPSSAAASIGVLPFKNMSRDPGEDYFSDGLSEELRSTLSRNNNLEVAAQTSSDSFRDKSASPREIAAALNVAFLLQGSVRRSADLLRISAQIVDGKTGFDKWSQSFDRKAIDVLGVQSEIAAFVIDALLAGAFFNDGSPAKRVGGTTNSEAFDQYLRGAALYKQAAGEKEDRAALARFDDAVRLDPNYAAAHAARSRALTVIANNYARHDQLKAHYQRSIDAARNAIRIEPELAEGHSALGFVLFNGQLDARAAEAPYQQSFELGYGNADILSAYANFAARIGRFDDGRKAIARAQRLDPLNPTVFRNAGLLEYAARDYNAALTPLRTALSLNPKSSIVHATMGDIALLQGRIEEAREHYDKERDAVSRLRGLAIADMRLSRAKQAEAHFATLLRDHGDISLYQQGQILTQWGQADKALETLEKALAHGDAGLVRSRNDPLLDPLRKAVKFAELQRKLGFE